MINAAELRIGNWVYYKKYTKKVYSVDLLGIELPFLSDISDVDDIRSVNSEEIDPIPLTEEWLVRFGFEKVSYEVNNYKGTFDKAIIYENEYATIFLAKNGKFYYLLCQHQDPMDSEFIYETKDLDYIHQLQNLVFALEGVELEMK